ncbi:hypothetical protein [Biostraticola tofi]|uniref:Uncharacterized protein n=1 Tax=Biostraticola tofi TaxID=466109 RepID=A0A4R3YVV1_9GAMM|nr:hypothetical protein [Biostraticola tofi]TCV96632.1 hypothetical protein EDC52_10472 [Biostraticola tofi]
MKNALLLYMLVIPLPGLAFVSEVPQTCSGLNNWAPRMAMQALQNANILEQSDIAPERSKNELLHSEKVDNPKNKNLPLYRLVQKLTLYSAKDGSRYEMLTVSLASSEECSMDQPGIMLFARHYPRLL